FSHMFNFRTYNNLNVVFARFDHAMGTRSLKLAFIDLGIIVDIYPQPCRAVIHRIDVLPAAEPDEDFVGFLCIFIFSSSIGDRMSCYFLLCVYGYIFRFSEYRGITSWRLNIQCSNQDPEYDVVQDEESSTLNHQHIRLIRNRYP